MNTIYVISSDTYFDESPMTVVDYAGTLEQLPFFIHQIQQNYNKYSVEDYSPTTIKIDIIYNSPERENVEAVIGVGFDITSKINWNDEVIQLISDGKFD